MQLKFDLKQLTNSNNNEIEYEHENEMNNDKNENNKIVQLLKLLLMNLMD